MEVSIRSHHNCSTHLRMVSVRLVEPCAVVVSMECVSYSSGTWSNSGGHRRGVGNRLRARKTSREKRYVFNSHARTVIRYELKNKNTLHDKYRVDCCCM